MMHRNLFFLFGFIVLFCIVGFSADQQVMKITPPEKNSKLSDPGSFSWKKVCHGLSEAEATRLAFASGEAPMLFVSTASAIYKSTGAMAEGFASLYLDGSRKKINQLYVDPATFAIYAASDEGLYATYNKGSAWNKIYSAEKAKGQRCLCVLTDGPKIFMGTTTGLYFKTKGAENWTAFNGSLRDKSVFIIKADKNFIYLGLPNEVYRLGKNLQGIKRIFSFIGHETDSEVLSDDESYAQLIKSLVISTEDKPAVYIISTKGIFLSHDMGNNWNSVPRDSLSLDAVTSAAFYFGSLFVAGNDGAYLFKDNIWTPIYQGAETNRFNDLAGDEKGSLYAATAKGVFKLICERKQEVGGFPSEMNIDTYFSDEPSIRDVQKMAIAYARVNPKKIGAWESQAQKKAWLPQLSMGLDSDRNRTISDNVYGSYTGGGQAYTGPRDKTFYSNLGWDVSLSWDLGELVWNPDQTSIDSRSKMMSELREDILNEVTRIYFERRRLQIEMLRRQGDQDEFYIERKMRIDELTALIDALTGGEFSEEIEKRFIEKQDFPLTAAWEGGNNGS